MRGKAIRATAWSAVGLWGHQGLALIVFLLLARLLRPEDFGLVALGAVYIAFLGVFVEQGFLEAIIQRHQIAQEHLDTAFWTNLGLSLVLTIACIATATLVGSLFGEPRLNEIIMGLSFVFVIAGLTGVQKAILRRRFNFRPLALASILGSVAGGATGILMAWQGHGVWSLVAYQLVTKGCESIVLWFYSEWRPHLHFSYSHFHELFRFGFNITGSRVLNFFNKHSADFVIGYFLGPVALGLYTVAFRLIRTIVTLLGGVVSQVSLSLFSEKQRNKGALRIAYYGIVRYVSLIAFPIFAGILATAPALVDVFFSEKWTNAIPIMRVLALIGILHTLGYVDTSLLIGCGRPGWRLYIDLLNVITNLIGMLIAVRWGIVAVAWAYVIRGYLLLPIPLLAVVRVSNIRISSYLRIIGPVTISSALVALAGFGVATLLKSQAESFVLVCQTLSGILVYVVSIRLLAPALFKEVLEYGLLALKLAKKGNP